MREIKFRAIRRDNNEFTTGYYCYMFDVDYNSQGHDDVPERKHYILDNHQDLHDIYIETLGQYTGLKDKNGVEIYAGDIFDIIGIKYKVEWHEDLCRYILTTGKGHDSKNCLDLTSDVIYYEEVIGNIYENPELLK